MKIDNPMKINEIITFMILMIFILTSCGCQKKIDIPKYIDPYFNEFLSNFKKDADKYGVGYGDINSITVIKFGDKMHPYGECSFKDDEYMPFSVDLSNIGIKNQKSFHKEIIFNKPFKEMNKINQYKTFLHEIGHCAYKLHHTKSYYSIMYYDVYPVFEWSDWNSIELEFFTEAKNNEGNWFNYEKEEFD